MDMIYIENLGVHHESRPLSPKLGVMIVTYDTDVIISYFISYEGIIYYHRLD